MRTNQWPRKPSLTTSYVHRCDEMAAVADASRTYATFVPNHASTTRPTGGFICPPSFLSPAMPLTCMPPARVLLLLLMS